MPYCGATDSSLRRIGTIFAKEIRIVRQIGSVRDCGHVCNAFATAKLFTRSESRRAAVFASLPFGFNSGIARINRKPQRKQAVYGRSAGNAERKQ